MPSAIALKPMGHGVRRGQRRPPRAANDNLVGSLQPASFDYDADTFYGSAERELVAPGIEARVECDPPPRSVDQNLHPMRVQCYRTRGGDE